MATTTPNYGWAVPTSTDLVKDGATAIETLGDAIDASMNTALGTKKAGMVLLNTTSFSGVASQSINDVFSSTYNSYKIIIKATSASSLVALSMRLRVGGADNSSSNYTSQRLVMDSTTLTGQRSTATEWGAGSLDSTVQNPATIEIFNPFDTKNTLMVVDQCHTITGNIVKIIASQGTTVTTSYTGFTLLCAQNITGEVSVYGFNK